MVKENKIRVHVIHGPNLNMLGKREPEIYGGKTLDDIDTDLKNKAKTLKIALETFQSNHESEIVEKIHDIFQQKSNGLIINPAAFTHTSVAINIYKREEFRHKSMISDIVTGQITGLGSIGYMLALNAIVGNLHEK